MNFGKAIKIARVVRGLSQKELADRAGLEQSYISSLETRRRTPSVGAINRLSAALGVSDYLLLLLGAESKDLRGVSEEQAREIGTQILRMIVGEEKSLESGVNDA